MEYTTQFQPNFQGEKKIAGKKEKENNVARIKSWDKRYGKVS